LLASSSIRSPLSVRLRIRLNVPQVLGHGSEHSPNNAITTDSSWTGNGLQKPDQRGSISTEIVCLTFTGRRFLKVSLPSPTRMPTRAIQKEMERSSSKLFSSAGTGRAISVGITATWTINWILELLFDIKSFRGLRFSSTILCIYIELKCPSLGGNQLKQFNLFYAAHISLFNLRFLLVSVSICTNGLYWLPGVDYIYLSPKVASLFARLLFYGVRFIFGSRVAPPRPSLPALQLPSHRRENHSHRAWLCRTGSPVRSCRRQNCDLERWEGGICSSS
jgi:hypothetical protein